MRQQAHLDVIRSTGVIAIMRAQSSDQLLRAADAIRAGVDMIKVFPASIGGPSLIKAIKAPLPQIELVPVGGVTAENAADFIRAGAAALGVGSALVNRSLLEAGDFDALTERAGRLIEAVSRGRGG